MLYHATRLIIIEYGHRIVVDQAEIPQLILFPHLLAARHQIGWELLIIFGTIPLTGVVE